MRQSRQAWNPGRQQLEPYMKSISRICCEALRQSLPVTGTSLIKVEGGKRSQLIRLIEASFPVGYLSSYHQPDTNYSKWKAVEIIGRA
ncbi:unnamed protein product [Nezara viridula]|uniref:Uncharacterized protein n=1 Tax=Nezara viridula TaxID=85310 RepID=A0A9P0MLW4_NEZVI|nr:unnamed protein product [Nezara viridula]